MVRFDAFSASNSIGPSHTENQDSYLADLSTRLFAVADGVGGYQGGKKASFLAIGALRNRAGMLNDEVALKSCVEDIHEQLLQTARSLHFPNMGTTISVAKVIPNTRPGNAASGRIITANAGDSPILLFPADTDSDYLKVFTDDSFRDINPSSMFAIIQYLGIESYELKVHTQRIDYSPGDILLICSDGITDNLMYGSPYSQKRAADLGELVRRYGSAKKIVEEALNAGIKPDDMTAVLVFL